MASPMEQHSPSTSRRRGGEPVEFNFREWAVKARMVSRENTHSRRFSASSYIKSFREDTTRSSFRSNFTISSTASSPGYTSREEIDPSTYSFTNALKALQARSVNTWECFSPEGFALNSKWNDAEKYICNPLSGEVPLECLSAKTLSGRSFRNLTNRITMSAPLIYSSQSRLIHTKPSITITHHENEVHIPTTKEKKVLGNMMTRDVGTQSTPPELTSSSPSPASTPPIQERSTKCNLAEGGDSLNSSPKLEEVEGKETRENEETIGKAKKQICRCRRGGGCLLSLVRNMWMGRRRHREKHKPRMKNIFPCHAS
ncbi:hypothetical protein RJ640_011058 [Escallonia rubra]|uniref:Uncharacterized protein n=1 Tax=Escallonia rubra TaxID=112253 RepID=A0AA88UMH7_9ASTE|nr:hypothetical protein RJ640_011058 [Escallonia rubra]